jgi:hypothetical protein
MNGCSIDEDDIIELDKAVKGKTIEGARLIYGPNDSIAIDFDDGTSLCLNADWFYQWVVVSSEKANYNAFIGGK